MLKIGITGGIGSGKTTICKLFEKLGIPVFYTDNEARKLFEISSIREEVRYHFGDEVMNDDGSINRKKIANIVFNDKDELKRMNLIVYPPLWIAFEVWCNQHIDNKYIMMESAILFETGFNKMMDYCITVSADVDVRIDRVMKRDKVTKEEVEIRMANQISDNAKINKSDYTIYNNFKYRLEEQVKFIHDDLITK